MLCVYAAQATFIFNGSLREWWTYNIKTQEEIALNDKIAHSTLLYIVNCVLFGVKRSSLFPIEL